MPTLKTVNYLCVYADGSMNLFIDDLDPRMDFSIAHVHISLTGKEGGGQLITFEEFMNTNRDAWNNEQTRIYVFEEWSN